MTPDHLPDTDPVNPAFRAIAARLNALRRKLPWLAEETGIPYQTLRNLRRRPTQNLSAVNAEKIALALGIPVSELLGGSPLSLNERNELVATYERLPQDLRTKLLAYAKGLLVGQRRSEE